MKRPPLDPIEEAFRIIHRERSRRYRAVKKMQLAKEMLP